MKNPARNQGNRLGIELLSFFGLPPLEQVELASALDCAYISCGPTQLPHMLNPLGFGQWTFRDDLQLRRNMKAALSRHGVSISLAEGFSVRPEVSAIEREGDIDIMAELGARGIGAVCMEPDSSRAMDELSQLSMMAEARNMLVTIEFGPGLAVSNLDQALKLVGEVDRSNFKLLIDAMHFFRSGGTVDLLECIDPLLIGYAQLCDVPLKPVTENYMDEAMNMRLAPGQGELPLAEFVCALPCDIPIGLEVPNLGQAKAIADPYERLEPVVIAAKKIIEQRG